MKALWKASCATMALTAMLGNAVAVAQTPPVLIAQPTTGTAGAKQVRDPATQTSLSTAAKIALLRQKVKYVFVLFQENRAFDHYFGTFPGANGTYLPGGVARTSVPGFTQQLRNTDGTYTTISPFLAQRVITDVNGKPVQLYPEDIYSVDHSHAGMVNDMHFDNATHKIAANDSYALDNEGLGYRADGVITTNPIGAPNPLPPTSNPTLATKQKGEAVMAHLDCDTIPFLWQWADRFTLFDNFRQTTIGPSTPNAIAMIAGQSGETQWALHPSVGNAFNSGVKRTGADGASYTLPAFPITADPGPYPGSNFDTAPIKPAYNPGDENPNNPAINLTSASLPLSFMGHDIGQIIQADQNPLLDLIDVQHDIFEVASKNPHVNWTWYEQGYGHEPFEAPGVASHSSYIVHHEGPQYFGYIADNTTEQKSLKALGDFYVDVANRALPAGGGVFYVRGGYANNDGLTPIDPSPAVQRNFMGNDDHGAYSDSQISEAMLADSINAIASSPYWKDSAIIITYDETDGFYDHERPAIRSFDPAGTPLTGGPRIPGIVLSPYSAAHTISRQYSEHSSVIKFIDLLFNLVPLADLPDEKRARALGQANLGQADLGPADDLVPGMGNLLEAFDNDRLLGNIPVLPASYAKIDPAVAHSLPHVGGAGACKKLGILPNDYATQADYDNNNPVDPAPQDFNPRPTVSPGIPYLEQTVSATGTVTSPWTP